MQVSYFVHTCSLQRALFIVVAYIYLCALSFPSPAPTATPLSGRPLAVLGVNTRHTLLYNIGLQQLFLGKPSLAFESLLEAVQVYHSNPRLWLRLAEACIATHCVVSTPTPDTCSESSAVLTTLSPSLPCVARDPFIHIYC